MYSEYSSGRRVAPRNDSTQTAIQRMTDMHLCTVSENGTDSYLSGEVLHDMRITNTSTVKAVEQALRDAFTALRIDVSDLGIMPLHLVTDHRGNAESWRLEYKDGWGAAGKRLLEKTRTEQQGAWVDL